LLGTTIISLIISFQCNEIEIFGSGRNYAELAVLTPFLICESAEQLGRILDRQIIGQDAENAIWHHKLLRSQNLLAQVCLWFAIWRMIFGCHGLPRRQFDRRFFGLGKDWYLAHRENRLYQPVLD